MIWIAEEKSYLPADGSIRCQRIPSLTVRIPNAEDYENPVLQIHRALLSEPSRVSAHPLTYEWNTQILLAKMS